MLPTIDRAAVICAPARWPSGFGMVSRQLAALGVEAHPVMGDSAEPMPPGFKGFPGSWRMSVAFRSIVEGAIRGGVEVLAIFEDDALLVDGGAATLAAFEAPADWEILYLGFQAALTDARNERLGPGLLRLDGVMATHACLYRATVLPKLLALPRDVPVDEAIAGAIHPGGRCYGCWPMAMIQMPGMSQITGEMGGWPLLWEEDGVR